MVRMSLGASLGKDATLSNRQRHNRVPTPSTNGAQNQRRIQMAHRTHQVHMDMRKSNEMT
jgi:hypothetical protein